MVCEKYAADVFEKIKNAGFEAYFVGGCVRDFLMGKKPEDYDIATNARPDEMKKIFGKTLDYGLKHGTVGVVSEGRVVEATTYRKDGKYSDSRHPENVEFTDKIEDDLKRRDFTVNAIASDLEEYVDLFDGRNDIEKKLIRCVGSPDERFGEDALRIMRALRFASTLDFEIERATEESILKNKNLLRQISAERIFSEFKKLLLGDGAERVLLKYHEVIKVFIPETAPAVGFDQKSRYHVYDVYAHIVKSVAACPKNTTVRLAAFFHDIGKPMCFSYDEKGGHFYRHAEYSREIAEKRLGELKCDGETKKTVLDLISDHDRIINPEKKCVKRLLNKRGAEYFELLLSVKRGDIAAHAPSVREGLKNIDRLHKIKEEILAEDECFSLKDMKVDGYDMMTLGFKGEEVGRALRGLLQAVMDGECENDRETLLKEAKKFEKNR